MIISTIVLLSLIALTAAFVVFRVSESRFEKRAFNELRTRLDQHAEELYTALVMGGIPLSWRRFVVALVHEVGHELVHFMVSGLRAVERPLARLSYRLRVSAPKTGAAPVSEFLKTITPDRTSNSEFQQKSV